MYHAPTLPSLTSAHLPPTQCRQKHREFPHFQPVKLRKTNLTTVGDTGNFDRSDSADSFANRTRGGTNPMPLISSNRLLFLAPRRRTRYSAVHTAALDLALEANTAPARTLTAEPGALVEDSDQVIALEDRPTPLGTD